MLARDIHYSNACGDRVRPLFLPRCGNCAAGVSFVLAMGICLSEARAESAPRENLAPASVQPFTAETAGEFVRVCISDNPSCADVIGVSLMNKIDFARTSRICLPGTDYAGGVVRWLSAHPETASMSTADGIFLALKTIYACGGPHAP